MDEEFRNSPGIDLKEYPTLIDLKMILNFARQSTPQISTFLAHKEAVPQRENCSNTYLRATDTGEEGILEILKTAITITCMHG